MTFPTPTGSIQPLTGFTDADTAQYITSQLPTGMRAEYNAYYQAAIAKDPSFTPFQAYGAWITGTSLANAIGTAGTDAAEIPGAAAAGAENAVKTLEAPANDFSQIANFLGRLEEPQTWLRVAEVVIGGIFLFIAIKGMMGDIMPKAPVSGLTKTKSKLTTAAEVGAMF